MCLARTKRSVRPESNGARSAWTARRIVDGNPFRLPFLCPGGGWEWALGPGIYVPDATTCCDCRIIEFDKRRGYSSPDKGLGSGGFSSLQEAAWYLTSPVQVNKGEWKKEPVDDLCFKCGVAVASFPMDTKSTVLEKARTNRVFRAELVLLSEVATGRRDKTFDSSRLW